LIPKDLDADPGVRVFRWEPLAASTLDILGGKSRIQKTPMRKRFFLSLLSLCVVSFLAVTSRAQTQSGFTAQRPANSSASSPAAQRENYDPLLDLPPLPRNQVTLIGGTVVSLDEIMNRMVVQPFGGKRKMNVAFDSRTHFYENGKPITEKEMKQGQRIYLDSMLNGSKVFAKTIWIRTSVESGMGQGQILDFDSSRQILTVRDELWSQPLKMHLTSATVIRKGEQAGSASDLVEGALVALTFSPQRELQQISVLATPGTAFSFAGRVTYVDMSRKMIAIDNRSDQKKYDVSVNAIPVNVLRQVREGADVSVSAVFDGNQYDARSVALANAAQQ
jgi:hypothetical protein